MVHSAALPSNLPDVQKLCQILGTDVTGWLTDIVSKTGPKAYLKVEASVFKAADTDDAEGEPVPEGKLLLGCVDLNNTRIDTGHISKERVGLNTLAQDSSHDHQPLTPESINDFNSDEGESRKRRKVVGGLRLRSSAPSNGSSISTDTTSDLHDGASNQRLQNTSCRQVHSETGFPQRKPPQDLVIPALEPTSGDKLISGIWKTIFSDICFTRSKSAQDATIDVRGFVDREVFRVINNICMKYYCDSRSARALEMVVQAYWVECYEARIVTLQTEKPLNSLTEIKMEALREACATFRWKEKELRNKLYIWRGYRDIKDAGGWASLIFASSGVYRFCKYRTGFDETLIRRLRQLRPSLEVAADTLHPEWRQILEVISQGSRLCYTGHPLQWVTRNGEDALPLHLTYQHIPDFEFRFIEESVLDTDMFGDHDPRRIPGIDPYYCQECGQCQSNNVQLNHCMCFPSLYGNPRSHPPVQIFQTSNGKNNGVVSRNALERGTAIGEFVGHITAGIEGVDVMMGGVPSQHYQIFQGKIGNFTRFINHSCRPNCQFQRFHWLGLERIVVVSRGIPAGSEITVDYSDDYWEKLDKECLCGETCCRRTSRNPNGRKK